MRRFARSSIARPRRSFTQKLIGCLSLAALAACTSADPGLVARAVQGTLTAVWTPTPIVVVVTLVGSGDGPDQIPTVTRGAPATAAVLPPTLTAAPASPTPDPSQPTGRAPTPSQPTPPPTPSAQAGAITPTPPGPLLFEDDFSQPSVWNTSEDDFQRTALEDGRLVFLIKVTDRYGLLYNLTRRARNFYAAFTGANTTCAFRDRYGLLFRVRDASNYYQFEVDCDGRYRLAKIAGGTLTPLKDWTKHPAVRAGNGAVNDLAVRAAGARLEAFANGQSLIEVTDSEFDEGGFGLYAGSGASPSFAAAFDNLRVWEIAAE